MKKLFTLIVFAFALVLGSQDAQAQQSIKGNAEAEAKAMVSELNDELQLNGDQQRALFRAYVAKDYQTREYLKDLNKGSQAYNEKKAEIEKTFDERAQEVLSAEQYADFKKMQMKK